MRRVGSHRHSRHELILELKKDFTVVIVTHSMSQAARVSDYTGFMYLGRMVEFNKTEDFLRTGPRIDPAVHYGTLWLR